LLGICASILSSTYIVTGAGTYTTTCLIPCIATNVSTDLATCSVSGIGTCTLTSSIVSVTCTRAVAVAHIRIICNAAIATAARISRTPVGRTRGPCTVTVAPHPPCHPRIIPLLGAFAFPLDVAIGLS
jgi:hypothetical protein